MARRVEASTSTSAQSSLPDVVGNPGNLSPFDSSGLFLFRRTTRHQFRRAPFFFFCEKASGYFSVINLRVLVRSSDDV